MDLGHNGVGAAPYLEEAALKRKSPTRRRLVRTAVFALVRGAGAAFGSAAVATVIWWLQTR